IKWWLAYHQTMLATLSSTSYIVTHYESYFYDPEVEIRRVVDFIGLEGTEDQIKQAALVNDLQLHRHVYPDELLDNASIPASVRQHYLSLRQEAGPVFQKLISDPVYQKQVFKLSLGQAHK